MSAPDIDQVKAYLGDDTSWSDDHVSGALAAEKAAQANVCTVPADEADWPADLAEALCRRVQHNLFVRSKPSGFESSLSELGMSQVRVAGSDAEVRRLEGPHRKRVVG